MYCPACGAENPDKARFCGSCSHRLDSSMEPGEPGQDDAGPIIDVENNSEVVSNGLKYGILGASLLIPFIGLVMGIIYLAKGENEDKKATGKLWLIASIVIGFFYLLSAGGGF